jgi:hypothetical protein
MLLELRKHYYAEEFPIWSAVADRSESGTGSGWPLTQDGWGGNSNGARAPVRALYHPQFPSPLWDWRLNPEVLQSDYIAVRLFWSSPWMTWLIAYWMLTN